MDPSALLGDLDADQRRAVTTESRLVAVIAGAGSGKTRVLTRRIAYRAATDSADLAHTLVLTFTREAAGELRRRLLQLGATGRVTAGTFHSVAHGLLRQRWADLDRRPKQLVTDRRRIVGDVMGHEQLDELVAELDWATARLVTPSGYEVAAKRGERRSNVPPARVADALARYEQEKRRRGVIDLDDLLASLIGELERSAEFADATRWRFRHLLVDEAQDLNPLQHRLIDLLRAGTDDLFLVGDPAQAIYGFTGSDPGLLVDVSERFAGVEVVRLPTNHRSTPQVVAAGAHVLDRDGQASDVVSSRPDGRAVTIASHADEHAESAAVAASIARLDPTLVRASRVAVLARTHVQLGTIGTALAAAGVPVRRLAARRGTPLAALVEQAYRVKDGQQMRRLAQDQLEIAEESRDEAAGEVGQALLDFLREQPTGDGQALRAWVDRTDPFGHKLPGVELQTFHAAKGREWHTVHVVGCETSLVPHRSATTNAARAEEARLLYVALTRATDELAVHWAQRRGGYQRRLSPFLDGIVSETPAPVAPPAAVRDRLGRRSQADVVLARLREWREATARARGIMPDAVCTDRALAAIAERLPSSPDQLDALTGLGPLTSRRLFASIADTLSGALDEVDAPPSR